MSRMHSLAVLALTAGVLHSAALPAQQRNQEFRGWGAFVDPDGTCKCKLENGQLTITIPNSTHEITYRQDYSKLNGPRVLQSLEGDFNIEVKVLTFPRPQPMTAASGPYSFVSAGILVWINEQNLIRLERGAESNSLFIHLERFAKAKTDSRKLKGITDNDVTLRLTRVGNKLTYYYKLDTKAGEPEIELFSETVELPLRLQVGVLANNTTIKEFAPVFEGLKIEKK